MDMTARRAGNWIAGALILSVVTQIIYMATLGGPSASDPAIGVTQDDRVRYFTERWPEIAAVWMTELAAALAMSTAALIVLVQRVPAPGAWAALLLAGLANTVQIAMGLAMFRPAATAGAELEPVLTLVIQGAFFFYFLAKVLIGLAGIGLGLALWGRATGMAKVIALAAIAVGAVAAAVNILALPQAMALVFPAGATGTAAALTTGLAALFVARLPAAR